jgi:hypothetical protein
MCARLAWNSDGNGGALGLTGLVLEVTATPDQGWRESELRYEVDAECYPWRLMFSLVREISKGLWAADLFHHKSRLAGPGSR